MSWGKKEYINDFRKIEEDLKSGDITSDKAILLCGTEYFLIEHYEKKITANFAENTIPEINYNIFYGDESSDDDIMASCDTFPMLGEYRVVVSRNHLGLASASTKSDKTTKKSPLIEYIKDIPESATLILSTNKLNKTSALFKAIKSSGQIYELNQLSEDDLILFVKKRFRASKLNISENTLLTFIDLSNYLDADSEKDLFSLSGDIQKISIFVKSEGRSEVTMEDLNECMETNLRADVFAMVNAISKKKTAEAINQLEISMTKGDRIFSIISLFISQFEIMLGYKEMSEKSYSKSDMKQIMGISSDYRLKILGEYSQGFTLTQLMDILHRFYSLEVDIKSGNISEKLALTVLLSEIS